MRIRDLLRVQRSLDLLIFVRLSENSQQTLRKTDSPGAHRKGVRHPRLEVFHKAAGKNAAAREGRKRLQHTVFIGGDALVLFPADQLPQTERTQRQQAENAECITDILFHLSHPQKRK